MKYSSFVLKKLSAAFLLSLLLLVPFAFAQSTGGAVLPEQAGGRRDTEVTEEELASLVSQLINQIYFDTASSDTGSVAPNREKACICSEDLEQRLTKIGEWRDEAYEKKVPLEQGIITSAGNTRGVGVVNGKLLFLMEPDVLAQAVKGFPLRVWLDDQTEEGLTSQGFDPPFRPYPRSIDPQDRNEAEAVILEEHQQRLYALQNQALQVAVLYTQAYDELSQIILNGMLCGDHYLAAVELLKKIGVAQELSTDMLERIITLTSLRGEWRQGSLEEQRLQQEYERRASDVALAVASILPMAIMTAGRATMLITNRLLAHRTPTYAQAMKELLKRMARGETLEPFDFMPFVKGNDGAWAICRLRTVGSTHNAEVIKAALDLVDEGATTNTQFMQLIAELEVEGESGIASTHELVTALRKIVAKLLAEGPHQN